MSKKTSLADYADTPPPPAASTKTTAKKPAKQGPEEVIQVAYRLPRGRWAETRLNDGDELHLFTAIAGG